MMTSMCFCIEEVFIYLFITFFFQGTDTLSRKKMLHAKTQFAVVYDYRTIVILLCMHIQYRRSLPYRADRSARYGKDRLYYRRLLYVHRIYMWLLHSRKAWAANSAIEWLPCRSIWQHKLWIMSTLKVKNYKSSLIILLVLFHSACHIKLIA